MLARHELTTRLLEALPPATAAAVNRLIRLEPWLEHACAGTAFLDALLRRKEAHDPAEWRPVRLGRAAHASVVPESADDPLAWLATSETGRRSVQSALARLGRAGTHAGDVTPIEQLSGYFVTSVGIGQRFAQGGDDDWARILAETVPDGATASAAPALLCLYGLLDDPLPLVRALVTADNTELATRMLLANELPATLEEKASEFFGGLRLDDSLTLGMAFSRMGFAGVGRAIAATADTRTQAPAAVAAAADELGFARMARRTAQRASAGMLAGLAGGERAFEQLAAALQSTQNLSAALARQLGRTSLASGDAVSAAVALEQAQALGDDDAEIGPDLAAAYIALGRADDALRQLPSGAPQDHSLSVALRLLLARARALEAMQNSDAAESVLAEAGKVCHPDSHIALTPADTGTLQGLAQLARKLERPQLAAGFMRHAAAVQPGSFLVHLQYAQALVAAGQVSASRHAALDALGLAPENAAAHSTVAEALMAEDETTLPDEGRALGHWQRASELSSDEPQLLFGLVRCALQAGRAKLARTNAQTALRMCEAAHAASRDEASERQVGQAHILLAEALDQLGENAAAFEHFQQATAICPTVAQAWRAVAHHHQQQGEPARAVAALEAGRHAVGTADTVGAAALLADLGQLQLAENRATEGIAAYQEAARLHPRNSVYHEALGRAMVAQGRTAAGIAALKEAARLAPATPALWHALGRAHEQTGEQAEALAAYEQAVSAGGSGPELSHDMGRLAFQIGRYDLARPALVQACAAPDPDVSSLVLLGSVQEKLSAFDEAITAYQRALVAEPQRSDIVVRLGHCCLQVGQPSAAIAALRGIAEQNLEDLAVHTTLAEAYLQEGLLEEAILSFEQATRLAPDDARLWRQLADAARKSGHAERAIEALERAIQLSPDQPALRTELGQLYADEQQWERARHALEESLEADSLQPHALTCLGRVLHHLGDSERSMAVYERAAALAPEDLSVLEILAQAHEKRQDYEAAHQTYMRALDACEEQDAPPDLRAHYLQCAGAAMWAMERPAPAAALWQRALRFAPDDVELLSTLGDTLAQLGRHEEAIEVLEHAITVSPTQPERYARLAHVAQEAGDTERALEKLRRAVEVASDDAGLHYQLGRALLDADQPAEALQSLELAQELGADDGPTLAALGVAHAALGDVPTAIDHGESALRAAPDDIETLLLASKVYLQAEQYPMAVEVTEKLVKARPDIRDYLISQAQALVLHAEARAAARTDGEAGAPTLKRDRKELGRITGLLDRADALASDEVETREWRGRAHAALGESNVAIGLLQPLAEAAPRPELLTALAVAYRRTGKLGKAREQAGAALDLVSTHVPALVEYGRTALKEGKLESSITALKRAVALRPDNAIAHYWFAETQLVQGSLELAEQSMNRALQLAPDHASWQHRLADICRRQGRRSAALAHDQRAVHLAQAKNLPAPLTAQYLAALAELYAEDGDARAARREYEAALEMVADNPAWLTAAGRVCLSTGDAAAAAAYFDRAASLAPGSSSPLIGATEAYVALGDTNGAETRILEAIKREPDNGDALIALGRLYAAQGKLDRALEAYEKAAERAPDSVPIMLAVARLLLDHGRAREADEIAERAIRADNTDTKDLPWALRGEACELLGDAEGALEAYRRASEASPLEAQYHLRQGQLCSAAGHLDQALVHFNRATELQRTADEGALAHFEIGRIFEARRQMDRAYEAFRDAIARQPDNPEYYLRAGMVLKQMCDYAAAQDMFQQAVHLDRKNLEARRQLAAVSALNLINESVVAA